MTNFASLCILSYNRPEYLNKTLNSLKYNTTEPYELIIHDDGSTDDHEVNPYIGMCLDDVLEWAQDQLGATVIRNKPGWNQGQGVALNRMFNIAKGDILIKLDADLEFEEGWLDETRYLIEGYTDIGLLGLLHYYHDPVDSRKTQLLNTNEFTTHTHILGSAFAMHRVIYNYYGPFSEYSEAFAEDWEMQKKITDSKNHFCALPKQDLVKNVGMGIGRSTVVTEDGSVAKIHKSPYVINQKI